MPQVSIILPTYNCGRHIAEALDGVLQQTFSDWEIIVVDDGSTDDTAEAIKTYRDRIIYRYQENSGASRSRNLAIEMSQGEFLAFLDADDIWQPFKLELQVKCLEALPEVGLVFSDFSSFDDDGYYSDSYSNQAFNFFREYEMTWNTIFEHQTQLKDIIPDAANFLGKGKIFWGNVFEKIILGNFILPTTTMLRKASLHHVGMFREKYRCAEDMDFFLRFCKQNKIAYIDLPLAQYRLRRVGRLSGKQNTAQLIENTLESLYDVLGEDQEFCLRNKGLIATALGKTYYRLAYYYLSERQNHPARAKAIESIKSNPSQLEAYIVYVLSYLPTTALGLLHHLKQLVGRLRQ